MSIQSPKPTRADRAGEYVVGVLIIMLFIAIISFPIYLSYKETKAPAWWNYLTQTISKYTKGPPG